MPQGPGKYDDLCTLVRERTSATGGVIVIVIGGNEGDGFSAQGSLPFQIGVPKLLEWTAAEIRRSKESLQ